MLTGPTADAARVALPLPTTDGDLYFKPVARVYRFEVSLTHLRRLHDGNVFVRDGRYLLFDWGDSCVSHPFLAGRIIGSWRA